MLDVAVRGARVLLESGLHEVELGIEGGSFAAIASSVGPARAEVDARGTVALPALIDVHVHMNEPGRTEWEGFETGAAALAAGGGSAFCDMPLNSEPPLLDVEALERKRNAALARSAVDFGLWGGLTPDNVDRLDALADAGVVGFKAFMSDSGIASFRAADDATLWQGMKIAAVRGLPVAVHAENDAITCAGAAARRAAGHRDAAAWVASRPAVAETEAIQRALHLAEDAGASVHIVHVSTVAGVESVVAARARGVDATCETCPHYLHFTEDDLERVGFALKCAPPVRGARTRAGLWRALRAGDIDLIASDHSPSPPEMKQGDDWFGAWGGVAGIQSTLAVLLEHVARGELDLPSLARLTAGAPAARMRFAGKGRIAEGYDADLVLVRRVSAPEPLRPADLEQRHAISPYLGERFSYAITRTIRRGESVYADGRIASRTGGRWLRPAPRDAVRSASDASATPSREDA